VANEDWMEAAKDRVEFVVPFEAEPSNVAGDMALIPYSKIGSESATLSL